MNEGQNISFMVIFLTLILAFLISFSGVSAQERKISSESKPTWWSDYRGWGLERGKLTGAGFGKDEVQTKALSIAHEAAMQDLEIWLQQRIGEIVRWYAQEYAPESQSITEMKIQKIIKDLVDKILKDSSLIKKEYFYSSDGSIEMYVMIGLDLGSLPSRISKNVIGDLGKKESYVLSQLMADLKKVVYEKLEIKEGKISESADAVQQKVMKDHRSRNNSFIGLISGITLNNITLENSISTDSEGLTGSTFGISGSFRQTDNFLLDINLQYSIKQWQWESWKHTWYMENDYELLNTELPSLYGETVLNYLIIGVHFHYEFTSYLYTVQGVEISYLISGTQDFENSTFDDIKEDITDYINPIDVGLSGGIGIERNNLFVEARYVYGLIDILAEDYENQSCKINSYYLTIGFRTGF